MNTQRVEGFALVMIPAVVGLAAGAASFTHVHDWTMAHSPAGTPGWFGWANACISELIPVAALLDIRRRRQAGQPVAYPMCLLIAGICLSFSAQLAVAKPSPSGWLLSAVPALAFIALTKLVFSRTAGPRPAAEPESSPAVARPTRTAEHLRCRPTDRPRSRTRAGVPRRKRPRFTDWFARSDRDGAVSPGTGSVGLSETAPFQPAPPASAPGSGAASVKHQPEAGASREGGREAAQRMYRDSVRQGSPLSTRDLALIAGCSPTTAWRAIQTIKQTTPAADEQNRHGVIDRSNAAGMTGSLGTRPVLSPSLPSDHR